MFLLSDFAAPEATNEVDLRLHRARPVSLGLVSQRASLPELKREKQVSPPELIEENNDELETTIPSEDLPAPVHLGRTDSHLGRLMTQVSNPVIMTRIGYACSLAVVLFIIIMLFHLSSRVSELQRTVTMLMLIRR